LSSDLDDLEITLQQFMGLNYTKICLWGWSCVLQHTSISNVTFNLWMLYILTFWGLKSI